MNEERQKSRTYRQLRLFEEPMETLRHEAARAAQGVSEIRDMVS
jgi:hypothetical protein